MMEADASLKQTTDDQGCVDPATVAACQRGDRAALHTLYQRCSRAIYGLTVRMVGRENADDVTQQVFLQVFRNIGQFQGGSRIETWIHRIAVNESLQYLRRQNRRPVQSLQHDPESNSPDRRTQVEDKELLDRALAQLDPQLRSLFLLREVNRMSYAELAEVLEVPEGTIGSRLNRARRELRQHLEDLGWRLES